jgi:2-polyprenyl-3-methyl-5-hydroxy-6-metoxy-1,4-benzoquinol methylase
MKPHKLTSKSRFEWALESVENVHNKNAVKVVFDIGSGEELMRNEITKRGITYHSFDLEPKTEQVRKWDVENPYPYEGKADVVLLMEVVEHFNNPWMSIKNISSVINPGGYLILTTPNPEWSDSRLNLLSQGKLTMFKEKDLRVNHHVFTPWYHIVEKLLQDNGFEIEEYASLYGKTKLFEKPLGLKLPVRLIYRGIKAVIEKKDASSIGNTYGIVAKKIS